MKIKIKLIDDDLAMIPGYKTKGSCGADLLFSAKSIDRLKNEIDPKIYKKLKATLETNGSITINPGESILLGTGICIELPHGYEAQVRSRSGLSSKGLILLNGVGTIDSDYRGEILLSVCNISKNPKTIRDHERIGQIVINKIYRGDFKVVKELSPSERSTGGFGSTGKL